MEEPQPQLVSELYTRLSGISGPALGVSASNEGMLGNKQKERGTSLMTLAQSKRIRQTTRGWNIWKMSVNLIEE
jgi:hypothetical protein